MLLPFFITSPLLTGAEPYAFEMEDAVRYAAEHNPQLRAARLQIQAAEARSHAAGRLENPELELGASTDQWGLNEGEGMWEVALAQKFPVTDRLRREKAVSQADVALAGAELAIQQWKIGGEVRAAMAEAITLRERAELHVRMVELDQKLVDTIEASRKRGEASQLDLSEAQIEMKTHAQEMRKITAEEAEVKGKLKILLGLEPTATLLVRNGINLGGIPTVNASAEKLAQHPEIQALALKEQRARASLDLAVAQRWQDVAVRLFLERETAEDEPVGLDRNAFVGVGVSIPLPIRTSRARVSAAPKLEVEAAQATTEAEAARIRQEIATAQIEAQAKRDMALQSTGEILTAARQHVADVTKAWETGQVDLVRLQRAQEQALRLEEAAIDARREYQLAKVRLIQAAGGSLQSSLKP